MTSWWRRKFRRYAVDPERSKRLLRELQTQRPEVERLSHALEARLAQNRFAEAIALEFGRRRDARPNGG